MSEVRCMAGFTACVAIGGVCFVLWGCAAAESAGEAREGNQNDVSSIAHPDEKVSRELLGRLSPIHNPDLPSGMARTRTGETSLAPILVGSSEGGPPDGRAPFSVLVSRVSAAWGTPLPHVDCRLEVHFPSGRSEVLVYCDWRGVKCECRYAGEGASMPRGRAQVRARVCEENRAEDRSIRRLGEVVGSNGISRSAAVSGRQY